MVTMPAFESGLALAQREGFDDKIGLHINLSEGEPLTDGIRRSRLFCDKEGRFNNCIRNWRILRFWLPEGVKSLIADEIRAQMKRFISYGLHERHYDSHGQVCVYWPILPVAIQCAKEFGFRSTRMFINMSASPIKTRLSYPRLLYIRHIDQLILKSQLRKTTHLGLATDLTRMIDELPKDSVVEVMTHPQYRNERLELSDLGEMMDWETPYQKSFGPILKCKGKFELISFNEL